MWAMSWLVGLAYLLISDSLVQPVRQSVRQYLPRSFCHLLQRERKTKCLILMMQANKTRPPPRLHVQTGSFVYLRLIKINRHMPRPCRQLPVVSTSLKAPQMMPDKTCDACATALADIDTDFHKSTAPAAAAVDQLSN